MSRSRRVAEGTLRVDAARAVAKLREYQLADPTCWVLEAIRAAMASGATSIEIAGDSNDVFVGWEGPPWEMEPLTALFDRLVSPKRKASERAQYLLATAVNTALAVMPRSVDIVRVAAGEPATRVRFTPDIYQPAVVDGVVSSSLRHIRPEPASRLDVWPQTGMVVHLRQPFRWDTAWRFLKRERPAELLLAQASTFDAGVPVRIKGLRAAPSRQPREDLIRLPFGQGLDGFLALTEASLAGEWITMAEVPMPLTVAELGVRVSDVDLFAHLEDSYLRGIAIPIRAFMSGSRMPTNASRSLVREDEAPVADGIRRAVELLPSLVEKLVEELKGAPQTRKDRLRAAALQLVASAIGGSEWGSRVSKGEYYAWLEPIMGLPLLRNAVGQERSLKQLAAGSSQHALLEAESLDPALAPWLDTVVWAPPGDDARRLFSGWDPDDVEDLVRDAQRLRHLRDDWLARPPQPVRANDKGAFCRIAIGAQVPGSCVAQEIFDVPGLEGEVLFGPLGRRSLVPEVRLMIEGRTIGWDKLPGCPFPIGVAVQSTNLHPKPDFSGVQEDGAYHAVMAAVAGACVRLVEAVARIVWFGASPEQIEGFAFCADSSSSTLTRRKTEAEMAGLVQKLGPYLDRIFPDHSESAVVLDSPIWPSTLGPIRSIRQWQAHTSTLGYVATVQPDFVLNGDESEARALPAGREAVMVDFEVARWFTDLMAEVLPRVDYACVLDRADAFDVNQLSAALFGLSRGGLSFPLVAQEYRGDGWGAAIGMVTPGRSGPNLWLSHFGVPIESSKSSLLINRDLVAIIEDEQIFPTEDWEGYVHDEEAPSVGIANLQQVQRDFIEQVACAFGQSEEKLHHVAVRRGGDGQLDDERVFAVLMRSLGARCGEGKVEETGSGESNDEPRIRLSDEARAALMEAPFIPVLGLGQISGQALIERVPMGQIDFVPSEFHIPHASPFWFPMRVSPEFAEGVSVLLGRPVASGARRIEAEMKRAEKDHRRDVHMQRKPALLPTFPGRTHRSFSYCGSPAVLQISGTSGHMRVRIHVMERPFKDQSFNTPIAIEAHICVPENQVNGTYDDLKPKSWIRLLRAVHRECAGLFLEKLREDPQGAFDEEWGVAFLRWLIQPFEGEGAITAPRKGGLDAGSTLKVMKDAREELRDLPFFRSIQGERVSLRQARTGRWVRCADYTGDWYGPAAGEKPSTYDRPIIHLDEGASHLREFLQWLNDGASLSSASAQAGLLQFQRRLAKGEIARPQIDHISGQKGTVYRLEKVLPNRDWSKLDVRAGEVALLFGATLSTVCIYEFGKLQSQHAVKTVMPIALGIEDPELARALREDPGTHAPPTEAVRIKARRAARGVGRHLLRKKPGGLTPQVVDALRKAIIRVPQPSKLEREAPIFPTVGGGFCSYSDLVDQDTRFGEVWWVWHRQKGLVPSEVSGRIVARLTSAEISLFKEKRKKLSWTDASHELETEADARRNQARKLVDRLELPSGVITRAIQTFKLSGDGWHAEVALLRHRRLSLQMLHLHAGGFPFSPEKNPFEWPVVTYIEAPDLKADKQWDRARKNKRYKVIIKEVGEAIGAELRSWLSPPQDALSRDVQPMTFKDENEHFEYIFWLGGSREGVIAQHSGREDRIEVTARVGSQRFVMPVNGRVLCFQTAGAAGLENRVISLARGRYRAQVMSFLEGREDAPEAEREMGDFHTVFALATGTITPEMSSTPFEAPALVPPLNMEEFVELMNGHSIVYCAGSPEEVQQEGVYHLILDDSAASDLLAMFFEEQDRLQRSLSVDKEAVTPRSARRERGRIRELMLENMHRLAAGELLAKVRLDRSSHLMRYDPDSKTLWLGGEHAILRSLVEGISCDSKEGARVLNFLTAHAIGLMNRELRVLEPADELNALKLLAASV